MTKPPKAAPRPELTREVALDAIGPRGHRLAIVASEAERAALAQRFGLLALERLEAEITLARETEENVRAEGRFKADVVQACVVTLDPVPAHLEEAFEVVFAPAALTEDEDEAAAGPAPAEREPLMGDAIDAGELVAQHLGLALDPYPRRSGASLEAHVQGLKIAGVSAHAAPPKPLSGLESLKKYRKSAR